MMNTANGAFSRLTERLRSDRRYMIAAGVILLAIITLILLLCFSDQPAPQTDPDLDFSLSESDTNADFLPSDNYAEPNGDYANEPVEDELPDYLDPAYFTAPDDYAEPEDRYAESAY